MISIIISTFIHSVILANPEHPTEHHIDQGGCNDEKSENDGDDDDVCDKHQFEDTKKTQTTVLQFDVDSMKDFSTSDEKFSEAIQEQGQHSHHTFQTSALSVDAMSYHENPAGQDRRPKPEQKHDKKKVDVDMKDFIKQVIHKKFGNVPALKFFDAAIVYDERDYSAAMMFRAEIIKILTPRFGDDLRIELFDSDQFAQSKVMVVQDVVDRCSVVLLYLTPNFRTPELNLFVEESVAMTRLGLGNFPRDNPRPRWSLKPVHTEPQSSRSYTVPIGLLSLRGINWYDKSDYTMNQIISIFNNAITERHQRETGACTDFAYQNTVNQKQHTPQHQNQSEVPSFLKVTQPPSDSRNQQLFQDAASFPESYQQSAHLETAHFSTHPSYGYPVYPQHVQHHQPGYFPNNNMNPNSQFAMPPQYPYGPQQQQAQVPVMSINFTPPTVSPGMPYTAHHSNQMIPPGYPPNRIHNMQTPYVSPSGLQQHVSPDPMTQYLSYQANDGMPSNASIHHHQHEYHQMQPTHGQRTFQPHTEIPRPENTSRTSVSEAIPSASNQYISNLSTDDVEIDNYFDAENSSKPSSRKSDKRNTHNKLRKNTTNPVRAKVDSDSDNSDSSDDEYTVSKSGRSKTKVINIAGCSIVQLGTGNKITKPKTPAVSIERTTSKAKPQKPASERRKNPSPAFAPGDSISEDNMSYTSTCEGDHNTNAINILTENQLDTKSDTLYKDINQTRTKPQANLNVTLNRSLENNASPEENVGYSPDTNFNEDELFVSGPIQVKQDVQTDTPNRTREAPFAFSQTRRLVNVLQQITMCKTSEARTETNEDSDLD